MSNRGDYAPGRRSHRNIWFRDVIATDPEPKAKWTQFKQAKMPGQLAVYKGDWVLAKRYRGYVAAEVLCFKAYGRWTGDHQASSGRVVARTALGDLIELSIKKIDFQSPTKVARLRAASANAKPTEVRAYWSHTNEPLAHTLLIDSGAPWPSTHVRCDANRNGRSMGHKLAQSSKRIVYFSQINSAHDESDGARPVGLNSREIEPTVIGNPTVRLPETPTVAGRYRLRLIAAVRRRGPAPATSDHDHHVVAVSDYFVNVKPGPPATVELQLQSATPIPDVAETVQARCKFKLGPSEEPHRIVLWRGSERLSGDITRRAGDVISNITFEVYDEVGSIKTLSAEACDKLRFWDPAVGSNYNRQTQLGRGRLPDIVAPRLVAEPRTYSISIGSAIGTLRVTATAAAPVAVKMSADTTVLLRGQQFAGPIRLRIVDAHGNVAVKPSANDLAAFKIFDATGRYLARTISLDPTTPGDVVVTDVSVDTRGSTACVGCRYNQAGEPLTGMIVLPVIGDQVRGLCIEGIPGMMTRIYNGDMLQSPLRAWIVDDCGAIHTRAAGTCELKILRFIDSEFTVTGDLVKSLSSGAVSFDQVTVRAVNSSTTKRCDHALELAGRQCHGMVEIYAKATVHGQIVKSPPIVIHVAASRRCPATVDIKFDELVPIRAGQPLPTIEATVTGIRGNVIANLSRSGFQVCLSDRDGKPVDCFVSGEQETVISSAGTLATLSGKRAPVLSGTYALTVTYAPVSNRHWVARSASTSITVVAGEPARLGVDQVIRSRGANSTVVTEPAWLRLYDRFNNRISAATVTGTVACSTHALNLGSPLRLDPADGVPFGNGVARMPRLTITPTGQDGSWYALLSFQVTAIAGTTVEASAIEPYHHLVQADKGQVQAEIHQLQGKIRTAVGTLVATPHQYLLDWGARSCKQGQLEELMVVVQSAWLRVHEPAEPPLSSITEMDKCRRDINRRLRHLHQLVSHLHLRGHMDDQSNVVYNDLALSDSAVYGAVGQLATIADDDARRALSHALQSKLDCLYTVDTDTAERYIGYANGAALAKDALELAPSLADHVGTFFGELPELPDSRGKPRLLRTFLTFPKHSYQCRLLFLHLCSDAVLIETIEDAWAYRKDCVVKVGHAADIYTRDGQCIDADGSLTARLPDHQAMVWAFRAKASVEVDKQLERLTQQIASLNELKTLLLQKVELDAEIASLANLSEVRAACARSFTRNLAMVCALYDQLRNKIPGPISATLAEKMADMELPIGSLYFPDTSAEYVKLLEAVYPTDMPLLAWSPPPTRLGHPSHAASVRSGQFGNNSASPCN